MGSNPTDRTNIELMRTYVNHESFFVLCFGVVYKKMVWQIFFEKNLEIVLTRYMVCVIISMLLMTATN